jgi:acyl-CoA thioesterase-1
MKKRGLPAMLTRMLAAPNMGADYTRVQPDLAAAAKKYDVPLVPFFLQPDRQQSIVIGR